MQSGGQTVLHYVVLCWTYASMHIWTVNRISYFTSVQNLYTLTIDDCYILKWRYSPLVVQVGLLQADYPGIDASEWYHHLLSLPISGSPPMHQ